MIQTFLLIVIAVGLLSFSSGSYYAQLAGGQVEALLARRPISVLVQAQTTPLELKRKLSLVLRLRAYTTRKLGLPENASYLTYTDIHRKFVVWNVTAVPEFSLNPLQWCFPLAGCVGYFSEDRAHRYATQLRGQGHDVYVRGISAYSTLGWFDDPVTSAMLAWEDTRIADFIFHELAHQRLYVANDTPFNEAFATTVAKIGVRRWLSDLGTPLALAAFDQEKTRERAFISLVLRTRKLLRALYAASLRPADKRIAKSLLFEQMQKNYAEPLGKRL